MRGMAVGGGGLGRLSETSAGPGQAPGMTGFSQRPLIPSFLTFPLSDLLGPGQENL